VKSEAALSLNPSARSALKNTTLSQRVRMDSRTSNRAVSNRIKKLVAYSQEYKCNYCLKLLPPDYQVDHIVPLHAGGDNSQGNLQALCAVCHSEKTFTEAIKECTPPFVTEGARGQKRRREECEEHTVYLKATRKRIGERERERE